MAQHPPVLFTAVRTEDGRLRDLLVEDGRIAAYDPPEPPAGASTVDARGALALPSPVDAHIHPDKTTWGGPWLSREPAHSLRDLIEGDVRARSRIPAPVAERAGALMDQAVARGTRAWRAHVDVAPVHGLSGVHGVRAAADARAELLDVQIVAFPQLGLVSRPGTAELLDRALSEGADILGGLDPLGVDGDLDGPLDFLFETALRRAVPLDIHLHDGGPAGLRQVAEIARRTVAAGLSGQVTLSHVFCLAELAGAELERTADLLAGAGIALTTCALGADPVLPTGALTRRGVLVAAGSDGVRDAWSPFGDADMIHRAHLLAYRTDARTDAELDACYHVVAHGGAALLGLPASRLAVGDPADFVLLSAGSLPEAVVDRPLPRLVVRAGRVVARDGRLV
ncbi:amidohydrolase family protein [Streptomyces clavuligerus]|nr:amidohydrolase [Streptomyces clavuligerus]ANW16873.1 cytosine deaminase [Streptomyces clavuligerus]AXU11402.1 cytosine deaminase [Streptomyces clavuligerus]MBY6301218.1 amidohydrolase family protein [Streptomyces clavuligerus]QCS04273.1 cytosine deaminase [Streptomyces clavuligerus]QPJ96338.1 amidohydrolase family protein [Streptomyces clavuligerus]